MSVMELMYNLGNMLPTVIETHEPLMNSLVQIQRPNQDHLSSMKAIADASRDQIGFIPRAKLHEAIIANRIFVALVNTTVVGFVIFRHRKTDQQTTLSEICVTSDLRGQRIGERLVKTLQAECETMSRTFIQLKCPVDLRANRFYEKLGFNLVATEPGKLRQLYVWRLPMKQER